MALVCAGLLCFLVLRTSMSRGRLAFFPRLDDVMYLARGESLLHAGRLGWQHAGFFGAVSALVHDWKHHPPHSPWSAGAAAAGFAIFGDHDWAAYVPTVLPVIAFLLCAARLARRAGGRFQWRAHALVLFAASAPFLAAGSFILKPDYAAGILAAIAMMNALRGPLVLASRRRLIWIGVLFGLALLAKPAMMVPTGMLALGTLAICTLRDRMLAGRTLSFWAGVGRAWGILLASAAIVAAPHFALAWRTEWAYMEGTLAGRGVDMWGYRGSWTEHTLYYLTGPGGRLMFDGLRLLLPLGVFVLVYACASLWPASGGNRRRRVYFIAILAALGMAWAGPSISIVKIPQFAACLSALLCLAGVHAAAGACARVRPGSPRERGWSRRPIVVSALIVAACAGRAVTYRWTVPLWPADPAAPSRAVRDTRDAFIRQAYESVRAEALHGARSIVVAGGQQDLGCDLLTLWSLRDRLELSVHGVDQRPAPTESAKAPEDTTFDGFDLVLVSRGITKTNRPKVMHADADEYYLDRARVDPRLELAGRRDEPGTKASYELYRRRKAN
jgi:hypothetical protein